MRALCLFVLLASLVIQGHALAAVPPMINYQGKLLSATGAPVADGAYAMTFAVYATPAGGTPLWSEPDVSVQVKGGLYSVLLGSVVNLPANIFDAPERYFGVKVGADAELAPRQRIASVPFAMVAEKADKALSAEKATVADTAILAQKATLADSVANGSITADKIAAQAITSQQLANDITLTGAISASTLLGAWDHSNDGYTRLGNLQIAWGKGVWPAGDPSRSCRITFPAPFIENPAVSVTTWWAQNVVRAGLQSNGTSTTSFLAFVTTDLAGAGAIGFDWIAIGRWQ